MNPRESRPAGGRHPETTAKRSKHILDPATHTVRQPCRLCPICRCGYAECRAVELVEAVDHG